MFRLRSTLSTVRALRPAQTMAVILIAIVVGSCVGSASATFDPTGQCGIDGRVAGAYSDLEARLPATFDGTLPGSVDSGRHCSEAALGSLIVHNISSVQFAGATWDLGGGTGVSSAIFRLPDANLPADWVAEFYEIGARTAKRTENIEVSRPTFDGPGEVFRLDTLNNLSLQSVLVWQDGPVVRVVLVATAVAPDATRSAHDELVGRAVVATAAVSSSRTVGG